MTFAESGELNLMWSL